MRRRDGRFPGFALLFDLAARTPSAAEPWHPCPLPTTRYSHAHKLRCRNAELGTALPALSLALMMKASEPHTYPAVFLVNKHAHVETCGHVTRSLKTRFQPISSTLGTACPALPEDVDFASSSFSGGGGGGGGGGGKGGRSTGGVVVPSCSSLGFLAGLQAKRPVAGASVAKLEQGMCECQTNAPGLHSPCGSPCGSCASRLGYVLLWPIPCRCAGFSSNIPKRPFQGPRLSSSMNCRCTTMHLSRACYTSRRHARATHVV